MGVGACGIWQGEVVLEVAYGYTPLIIGVDCWVCVDKVKVVQEKGSTENGSSPCFAFQETFKLHVIRHQAVGYLDVWRCEWSEFRDGIVHHARRRSAEMITC